MKVQLTIPAPFKGGEWRISKEIVGSRGGKYWIKVISQAAAGGAYIADLEDGEYKETYWFGGSAVPRSRRFEVQNGRVCWQD